nr:FecR domain-containing protein [Roseibium sp. RKSG952]
MATGRPPGRAERTVVLGDQIIYEERIRTTGTGLVQVLLRDGSIFTIGANSDFVIDEFVYDPDAGSGRLAVSFGKGVARFVGGRLSKTETGVTVRTPVGVIGIRGAIADLRVAEDEGVFSLVYGRDIVLRSPSGEKVRIFEPGYAISVGLDGPPKVHRATPQAVAAFQSDLMGRPAQRGGIRQPPTGADIARSGLPDVNSGRSINRRGSPPPPKGVRATSFRHVEPRLIQPHTLDQRRLRGGIDTQVPAPSPPVPPRPPRIPPAE